MGCFGFGTFVYSWYFNLVLGAHENSGRAPMMVACNDFRDDIDSTNVFEWTLFTLFTLGLDVVTWFCCE